MTMRLPRYAPAVLFLMSAAAVGCDSNSVSVTAPAALNAELQPSIAVEPDAPRPEFLLGTSCPGHPPFGLRLRIVLGGGHDWILRGLRFHLTAPFGGSLFPEVIPIHTPGTLTSIPTTMPIPLPGAGAIPGASPISIGGSSPIQGLFIRAGTSHSWPYLLRFGCGVPPAGSIIVNADGADRSGRFTTSQVRVRVAW